MHEYPITCKILEMAEKQALEANASRITAVNLVVGDMSGFIGESIQMYFDVLSKHTLAEDAVIRITQVRSKLRCESCGALFIRERYSFQCPECGGQGVPTEIGKEFYLESVEIEKD